MKRTLTLFACVMLLAMQAHAQYSTTVNKALSVSGAGYISVPNNSMFNSLLYSGAQMAIDAWVYPGSLNSYMTIVGNTYSTGYWLGITPSGSVRFYPYGTTPYDSPGTIAAGQWSHVGISFNARKNSLSIYINGALNATFTTAGGNIGTSPNDLRIGADRSGNTPYYFWNGMLDEVRIWNNEMNFSAATGLLYRIPHALSYGRYGKYLVGCWRLNGDGTSETANGDGTLVGAGSYATSPLPPHYTRICAILPNTYTPTAGGSIDYFSIPSNSQMQFTYNYTAECWIKPAAAGGSSTLPAILYKGSDYGGSRTWGVLLNKSTSKIRFVPAGDLTNYLESSATIPNGQWTHVAVRFASGPSKNYIATIFINGAASGTKSYTLAGSPNEFPLYIGSNMPYNGQMTPSGFSGSIDEVRIWAVSRTDADIADNYRMEFNGPATGLVGCYRLDGDIHDLSGNSHDGTQLTLSQSDQYFNDASDLPAQPSVTVVSPNGAEAWMIGTTRSITWTSSGISNVRIELSRDGGSTYPEVLSTSTPAAAGSFNWTVTAPPTNEARVRISSVSNSSIQDISDRDFLILEAKPTLSVTPLSLVFSGTQGGALPPPQKVYIQNTGGGSLSWTAAPGAGGWLSVSPSANTSNKDSVNVQPTSTAMSEGSYSDIVTIDGNAGNAPITVNVTYRITSKPVYSIMGGVTMGGSPVFMVDLLLTGDMNAKETTATDGRFTFDKVPAGNYTLAPSSPFYDFTPTQRQYMPLSKTETTADFTAAVKKGRVRIKYKEGWNLLSIPVVPTVGTLSSIFPSAFSPAYYFKNDSGYIPATTLEPGRGYWVKFPYADSVDVSGDFIVSMDASLNASFGGWNMIGVPVGNVPMVTIITIPSSIMLAVYAYDPVLGYQSVPAAGALGAGNGYFVKTAANGTMYMNSVPFAPIVFPDARFSPSVVIPGAELPPPPPGN